MDILSRSVVDNWLLIMMLMLADTPSSFHLKILGFIVLKYIIFHTRLLHFKLERVY